MSSSLLRFGIFQSADLRKPCRLALADSTNAIVWQDPQNEIRWMPGGDLDNRAALDMVRAVNALLVQGAITLNLEHELFASLPGASRFIAADADELPKQSVSDVVGGLNECAAAIRELTREFQRVHNTLPD